MTAAPAGVPLHVLLDTCRLSAPLAGLAFELTVFREALVDVIGHHATPKTLVPDLVEIQDLLDRLEDNLDSLVEVPMTAADPQEPQPRPAWQDLQPDPAQLLRTTLRTALREAWSDLWPKPPEAPQ